VNLLEQALLGWESLLSALRVAFKPVVWPPWLLLGLARIGAIAVLVLGAHPLVSWIGAPLVTWLGGPGALHYPVLFRLLPRLVDHLTLPIDVVVGGWAAGVTSLQVVAMTDRASRSLGGAMKRSLARLPALVVAELPALALGWVLSEGVAMWLESRGSGGLVIKAVTVLAALLLGFTRVYFCWLPVMVVADGRGVLESWRELRRFGGRGYGAALTVGLLTLLPMVPFALVLRAPGRWIDIGHPEWVAGLLGLERIVTLLTAMLATIALALAWRALVEDPWGG
jgi:hypothetical protein